MALPENQMPRFLAGTHVALEYKSLFSILVCARAGACVHMCESWRVSGMHLGPPARTFQGWNVHPASPRCWGFG